MKGHTIPWSKEKENDDDKQWPTRHYTENDNQNQNFPKSPNFFSAFLI
jgi:hypothetical protein